MMNAWAEQRHRFLIDSSLKLLTQGLELLDRMNDWGYISSPDALPGQHGEIAKVVQSLTKALEAV